MDATDRGVLGNPALERALVLLQQRRPELAEQELRRALAAEPEEPAAHALLALCLAQQDESTAALREAEAAVGLAPNLAFAHHARAAVLAQAGKLRQALPSAREAVRLDPQNADLLALVARLCLLLGRREEGWAAVEAGLQIDPQHVALLTLRAGFLLLEGRLDEAERAIDRALALDPEDPDTQASRGWLALRRGDPGRAREHLREALRLDPHSNWARQGLAEAIKAQHGAYAVLVRAFLWLALANRGTRLAVAIGGLVGFVAAAAGLGAVALTQPGVRALVWPALLVLLLVVFAYPLSSLLLRHDPFGRLLLKQDQIDETNVLLGLLVVEALCGVAIVAGYPAFLYVTIASACVAPLVWYTFHTPRGWPRALVAGYTVGEALLGLWVLTGLIYGFTLSPARAYRFAPIWLAFFLLVLLGPLPGIWLAEHLQRSDSLGRRLGRHLPWPTWLDAP